MRISRTYAFITMLLIVIVPFCGCITDGELTLEERAEYEVIDNLREGHYDVVYSLFNDDMKDLVSEEELGDLWQMIEEAYGPIVDIEGENAGREDLSEDGVDYIAVYVPCEFEDGTRLQIQVVFDEDELVAGLWFLPD
ncbi:MAG TPA: DUF3887 domain-containing protein [Candidatus Methanofastidiosa archaeon]|nr:DUF3887 domain-containing protein [Candidatus Methanofastidiosa archaeon]